MVLSANITFPIYVDVDGVKTPFHGLVLKKAAVDNIVMSLGGKITGDIVYKDNSLVFSMREYVEYNGTKHFIVNPPTVTREGIVSDNSELKGMTRYSLEFYHPEYWLSEYPFTDVAVRSGEERYLSQDKTFSWIGNLEDYIDKLNENLYGTEWMVVLSNKVDQEIKKMLSEVLHFDNNTIADALKTLYDTWKTPFTTAQLPSEEHGKKYVVTVGLPSNEIYETNADEESNHPFVFKFGQGVGLKNNSRTPKNNKIITRIAPYGSEKNIPYGYPQIRWYGDSRWDYTEYEGDTIVYDKDGKVTNTPKPTAYPLYMGIVSGEYVKLIKHPFTRKHLMPSVYAETIFNKVSPYKENGDSNERYDPNTKIIDYYDAIASEKYPFVNEINPKAPSYETHGFENIKPELGEAEIIDAYAYGRDNKVTTMSDFNADIAIQKGNAGDWEYDELGRFKNHVNSRTDERMTVKTAGYTIEWSVETNSDNETITATYTSDDLSLYYEVYYGSEDVSVHVDWDDTMDDDGAYKQSYFKIELPILNFDLYACAAITEEMQINMRSGDCLGCTFSVQVDWEDYKRNFYDLDGNFLPDGEQRDLSKFPKSNERNITVIVQKDLNTFGTLMPNTYQYPKGGDAFVILGISLPVSYIKFAETKLDEMSMEYMLENNIYHYEYPLKFDEFFLATHVNILSQIRPNSVIRFEYSDEELELYVKQLTVKYGESPLPKYNITLTDNVEVVLNQIGQASSDIQHLGTLFNILNRVVVTQSWVEKNYVSIPFFEKLFGVYNGDTRILTNSSFPSDSGDMSVKSMLGLWTEKYLSALGKNEISGEGGGTDMGIVWSALSNGTGEQINASHMTDFLATQVSNAISSALSGYATQAWIEKNGYATRSWVDAQGFLTRESFRGTVTSVALSVPTGMSVVGSPVTSSGTIGIVFENGYGLIKDTERSTWNNAANAISSIIGANSDEIINKWEEIVAFLDTYTEADKLSNLLSNKADKTTKIEAGAGLTGGGSLESNRTLSLATSGVTAGTYTKINVDEYGRAISGTSLSASDIPNLDWSKITTGKPKTLSGYGITDAYTKEESDERYLTVAFFGRLFRALNGSEAVNPNDTTTTIDNIEAMFGFWTKEYISALGKNSAGGGTGGGDVYWSQLESYASEHSIDTRYLDLSAYALKTDIPTLASLSWSGYSSGSYNGSSAAAIAIPSDTNQLTNGAGFITSASLPTKLSQLSNDVGYTTNVGTVTQVKVGSATYNPSSGVVSLPAYPTTLPASDVYAWAKAATKPSYSWGEIVSRPTALSAFANDVGYVTSSIVDGYLNTGNWSSTINYASLGASAWSVNYAASAGNADTVDGYHESAFAHRATPNNLVHAGNEITMIPDNYQGSLWLNWQSVGRDSSSDVTAYCFGNGHEGALAIITQGNFSGNAYSATKLQTARTIWGQSFDGSGNVSGNLELLHNNRLYVRKVDGQSNFHSGIVYDYGGNEAFVFTTGYTNARMVFYTKLGLDTYSSLDFQTRIPDLCLYNNNVGIGTHSPSYKLDVNGYTNTSRLYLSTNVYLEYDSVNGGIHVVGAGLYSDSYISALGSNTAGGGGGVDMAVVWSALAGNTSEPISLTHISDALATGGYATQSWVGQQGYALTSQIPTNNNQLANGAGYITGVTSQMVTTALGYTPANNASLSYYLPLSGGNMSGVLQAASVHDGANDVYNGGIQLREYNYSATSVSSLADAPSITFHWGGRVVNRLSMGIDGHLYWGQSKLYNTDNLTRVSQLANDAGYITSSGSCYQSQTLGITGFGAYSLTYYQTANAFDGNDGWCHYIIGNHGDGYSYYHYTIGLPFWGVPIYKRQTGSVNNGTRWYSFITEENIASQSVNYAASAGNADTVDGYHESAFAHRATPNNLVHTGNEITMIPDNYQGVLWLNYQSVGRDSSSDVTVYYFGNGHGGVLAAISQGNFSGNAYSATKLQTARTIWGRSFDGTANIENVPIEGVFQHILFSRESWNYVCVPASGGVLAFNIGVAGTANTKMCVANNGNVGIGTTSPSYKLDVNGTFYASGNVSVGGALTVSGSATIAGTANATTIYENGTSLAAKYLQLSGGTMTGTLNMTCNTVQMNFRTGHSAYNSKMEYMTAGNEAMVWANKNAVTSFIFKCGLDLQSTSEWRGITPSMQIKHQSVYVNQIIPNDVTPLYNLYVNGTACFTGNVTGVGMSTAWSDVWSDGSVNHPWYGIMMNGPLSNYHSTISDYYGMTLRTRNAWLKMYENGHFELRSGDYYIDASVDEYGLSINYGNQTAGDSQESDYYVLSVGNSVYISNTLDVDGVIHSEEGIYSGGYVSALGQNTSSDMRMKNVIDHDALPTIEQIAAAPAVHYTWKENPNMGLQVGSVAQYWQSVLPESVHADNDGYLSMQYGVIALLASIASARKLQEHERRISELEKENEILREQINRMRYVQ